MGGWGSRAQVQFAWGAPRAKWINFIGGRISGFTEGDHIDMVPINTDRWSPPISVWRSGWAYNTQMTSIHLCEIITWRQGTTGSLNKHSNKNTTLLLVVSGIHPLHLWDTLLIRFTGTLHESLIKRIQDWMHWVIQRTQDWTHWGRFSIWCGV